MSSAFCPKGVQTFALKKWILKVVNVEVLLNNHWINLLRKGEMPKSY